jgi:hypothetical protein
MSQFNLAVLGIEWRIPDSEMEIELQRGCDNRDRGDLDHESEASRRAGGITAGLVNKAG